MSDDVPLLEGSPSLNDDRNVLESDGLESVELQDFDTPIGDSIKDDLGEGGGNGPRSYEDCFISTLQKLTFIKHCF